MQELTINGQVFQFHYGVGFLKEINKKTVIPVEGMPGQKKNVGLRYTIMKLYDGDVETLLEVLDIANKNKMPRVTKEQLESYIDDENTDIDELFEETMGFLKKTNATKKETLDVLESIQKAIEEQKKKEQEKKEQENRN